MCRQVTSLLVNKVKNRLSALSMLDRAFRSLTDAQITSLYQGLDEEGHSAVQHIAGIKGEDLAIPALVEAVRTCTNKGRMNGDLERMAIVLTDGCLSECIEALGSNADDPSEENLRSVLPAIIDKHGLEVTQVMLATVVTGEALASPIITRFLKSDPAWKLPPAPVVEFAPLPAIPADDAARLELKEQRKARKLAEQEAARRRREQASAAKRK